MLKVSSQHFIKKNVKAAQRFQSKHVKSLYHAVFVHVEFCICFTLIVILSILLLIILKQKVFLNKTCFNITCNIITK